MIEDMGKFGALFGLFALSAFGASDDDAIRNTFVKPWIEALRSKDKARIERFYHPAVRACINPGNQEYFDFTLDLEADADTSGADHITRLAPIKSMPAGLLPEDGFRIPVQPTYEIQVDFDPGELMVEFLAQWNGSWFEVLPCPNEKGMAYFRKQFAESAEQRKEAVHLLTELKDPLRSELKDLLKRQQKIDAIKKYQAAASVDLTTAVLVINALQKSKQ